MARLKRDAPQPAPEGGPLEVIRLRAAWEAGDLQEVFRLFSMYEQVVPLAVFRASIDNDLHDAEAEANVLRVLEHGWTRRDA